MKADVLVIGENRVFCDIVFYRLPRMPKAGEEVFAGNLAVRAGGAFLPAAGLARLGMDVVLSCVLGDDPLSRFVLEQIKEEGIKTSLVRVRKGAGIPTTVSLSRADRAFVSWMPPHAGYIPNLSRRLKVRHVHLPGFSVDVPVELLRGFKDAGATVSVDASYQTAYTVRSRRIKPIFGLTDVFFCNRAEAVQLTGESRYTAALKVLGRHFKHAVVKLGHKGAACISEGRLIKSEPYPAEAVDTTGAGEAFVAGYLYGFLNGYPVSRCLKIANYCGARSTEGAGLGNFPNLKELARLPDLHSP
ncbi:MAG TPA: carbohydrate kinase family protein [Proteobacteria bacterium]|nr:carbohydrate kinase family protein [Pseudomonadota bacterium]